jgi:hypothetical protein
LALLLKDRFDRRGQSRAADLEEYKKIASLLTDTVIATLQAPDFLAGMAKVSFHGSLNDLINAYEGNRALIFHDKNLNIQFHALYKSIEHFLEKVAELTVPEGEPPRVTTRPRADRVYPTAETRKRSAEEAKALDDQAKELSTACRSFVDNAKGRLRT